MSVSSRTASDLCQLAVESKSKAYCPYSHFRVGAALLGTDGQIYTGCNIENASYGLTICAERTAMAKAISSGCTRFHALAVSIDGPVEPSPCGSCRQFMVEFGNFPVLLSSEDGSSFRETTSAELLPGSFSLVDAKAPASRKSLKDRRPHLSEDKAELEDASACCSHHIPHKLGGTVATTVTAKQHNEDAEAVEEYTHIVIAANSP